MIFSTIFKTAWLFFLDFYRIELHKNKAQDIYLNTYTHSICIQIALYYKRSLCSVFCNFLNVCILTYIWWNFTKCNVQNMYIKKGNRDNFIVCISRSEIMITYVLDFLKRDIKLRYNLILSKLNARQTYYFNFHWLNDWEQSSWAIKNT